MGLDTLTKATCALPKLQCIYRRQASSAAALSSSLQADRPQPRTPPLAEKFATPIPLRNSKAHESAKRMAQGLGKNRALSPQERIENKRKAVEALDKTGRARDLEKLQIRRWKAGDVYAPHDLSPVEMQKWRRRHQSNTDVFDALAINPLHEYKNFSIMTEYMTTMGRIRHSRETGLRAVNQRRIAKAIRRAVGMGLMPSVHKHPEILEAEATALANRGGGVS